MAEKYNIVGDKHVQALLKFLHDKIGVIQYHDKRRTAIKDHQFLYELVIKTTSYEKATVQEDKDIEEGILSASALKREVKWKNCTDYLHILADHHIISEITDGKYFAPCILNEAPEEEINRKESLFVKYMNKDEEITSEKWEHCPFGVFGDLVIKLKANKREEIKFLLITERLYKNKATFKVLTEDTINEITLLVFPSKFELHFIPESSQSSSNHTKRTGETCRAIRHIIQGYLEEYLEVRGKKVKPVMCLKCFNECCNKLHGVDRGRAHNTIYCTTIQKRAYIPSKVRHWYHEGGEDQSYITLTIPISSTSHVVISQIIEKRGNEQIAQPHLQKIAQQGLQKWRMLHAHLGISKVWKENIDRTQKPEEEKKIDFLQEWSNQKGEDATYVALVLALNEIDCRSDIEYIFELLQKDSTSADYSTN